MKIIAFLQNMWVRDPHRVRALIERDGEEFRRRIIEYSLFAGCVTGRRLRAAFGDLCDDIVWEESTREIAGNPRDVFPPDLEHIRTVLLSESPDCILAFGRIASGAVGLCIPTGVPFYTAVHPAARVGAVASLSDVAARVRALAQILEERTLNGTPSPQA